MNLIRYTHPRMSPGSAFRRLGFSDLERELDSLFRSAFDGFESGLVRDQFPVDLYEDKDNTFVRAELPGVERDAINVEMVDGFLTISANRKSFGKDGEAHEEVSFHRSVKIPDEADDRKVSASYENGILTVTLPKKEEAKPKKISIEVK